MNGYNDNSNWRFQPTVLDPKPSTNASSRIIPSPSNTNWNSTFSQNNPGSPSGTDWQKQFGTRNADLGIPSTPNSPFRTPNSPFSFTISPTNSPTLSSTPQPSDFFRDRASNLDLTSRDHQLYGAGPDLGFND